MNLVALSIEGAFRIESPVFDDDRGFAREWHTASSLAEAGVEFSVRQANLSHSHRNVVRGLHYSLAPEGQAKVVTCASGSLDDVLVDVRVGSPTFGVIDTVPLAARDGSSVYVPAGVAHGFGVTSEFATIVYLLSSPYNPSVELEINPFDETLAVPWRLTGPATVSPKDAAGPTLAKRRVSGQLPPFSA